MTVYSLMPALLAFLLAPLMVGAINRVKAFFAGRQGVPVLQLYFDLAKLFRKGAVYGETTTWVLRTGPAVVFSCVSIALLLTPLGSVSAPLAFAGDFLAILYLLALARFFLVVAALDTGSSFEGMGASREIQFSALAEPAVFLALMVLSRETQALSLSNIYGALTPSLWPGAAPVLLLTAMALFVVLLAENARIPVDDPNTHLELTMIHEAMILDYGGPDCALLLYASALKLWLFAMLVVGVIMPVRTGSTGMDALALTAGIFVCAVAIGVVESTMARLRLLRVPQLLVGAAALAAVGLMLTLWGRA